MQRDNQGLPVRRETKREEKRMKRPGLKGRGDERDEEEDEEEKKREKQDGKKTTTKRRDEEEEEEEGKEMKRRRREEEKNETLERLKRGRIGAWMPFCLDT